MSDEYTHHPAAELFPLMDEASPEFRKLVEDIEANGLREPIVVTPDKQIVDGRNRHRACCKAGVKPVFRAFDSRADGDLLTFVISKNLHRRHLSVTERSKVALALAMMKRGGDRRSQTALMQFDHPAMSRAETAEAFKVSERSVNNAATVYAKGAPQLVKAFDRGEVPVTRAAGIAQLPKDEQREAVATLSRREQLRAVADNNAERYRERNAKRESPVSERRRSHGEMVMMAATPAERRAMIACWWDRLATDADKEWLIDDLVTPHQNAKYGFGDRDEERDCDEERDHA